ncbi:hypothetical protein ACHHRT_12835 [Desulfurivibrio sp. D14AmB]|uniref:hypothetical protein n=1 Tax=Desulfurivibrio sp. D14AmB TaxID=3374370 RepID=UPI00376EAD68
MQTTKSINFRHWPLLCLLLAPMACSGSSDPAAALITAPSLGVDAEGVNYIGSDRCLVCHNQDGYTPEAVASYLQSRHARPGTVAADADAGCLACHDPLGDGLRLEPWFLAEPRPAAGMTAVGCENCHGAGPHHLAVIPEHPNAAPDFNACGRCHTDLAAAAPGHPAAPSGDIIGKYLAGPHAAMAVRGTVACQSCHSDEGFRSSLPTPAIIEDPSPVQCRTCHDGHGGELRGEAVVGDEGGVAVPKFSRLFNLCTSCHQVTLKTVYSPNAGNYVYYLDTDEIPFHGQLDQQGVPVAGDRVIWDTHFATEGGTIAGYNINAASEFACLGCHDPHSASKPTLPAVE